MISSAPSLPVATLPSVFSLKCALEVYPWHLFTALESDIHNANVNSCPVSISFLTEWLAPLPDQRRRSRLWTILRFHAAPGFAVWFYHEKVLFNCNFPQYFKRLLQFLSPSALITRYADDVFSIAGIERDKSTTSATRFYLFCQLCPRYRMDDMTNEHNRD